MNKKIIVMLTVIVLLMISIIILSQNYDKEKNTSESGARIVVYQEGKSEKINPESAYFEEFQGKCESLFVDADDALLLSVTDRVIDQARENAAVEIIYSEPREFTFQKEKPYTIKVDALLISFVNNSATIYYSIGGSYSSGPYVNTKADEIEKCKSILQKI